jgi:hypothetical protein
VPRNPGLMDVHALDNVAYGAFPRLHRPDDANAGWISECLNQINLRIHAYRTVKYQPEAFPKARGGAYPRRTMMPSTLAW